MTDESHILFKPDTGCYIWTGAVDGYGLPLRFEKSRAIRVKRERFEQRHGYCPARIEMTCGERLCVNVEHMVAKTRVVQQKSVLDLILMQTQALGKEKSDAKDH